MQTFLPYESFRESWTCVGLDRLGKQRVEIYKIIKDKGKKRKDGKPYKGWLNHPCTVMWRPYLNTIKLPILLLLSGWIEVTITIWSFMSLMIW